MTGKLVSIVIPCFNCADWIEEAIESCLNQTYGNIEIIVVDDGSTDNSVEIVKKYGARVIHHVGPNRGGCHARNLGFKISRGEFIQFLDADDYILPEKIEIQVGFLESSGSDIVYCDWRHEHHKDDGTVEMEEIKVSGGHEDVLLALLSGWWVATHALLSRRDVVERFGGWDETLTAAQDKDFFISAALTGADIRYQPGCYAIYRRHGSLTVSTSNKKRWLDNNFAVLEKTEKNMAEQRKAEKYFHALAHDYHRAARNYFELDKSKYKECIQKIKKLNPNYVSDEGAAYKLLQKYIGFHAADQLALVYKKIKYIKLSLI